MPLVRAKTYEDRSAACHNRSHEGCRHIIGRGARIWPGPGPQRHLTLCACPCHADCALNAGVVGEEDQLTLSCTCFDHTASVERRRQIRAADDRRRAALAAADQKTREDMDRSQIRQTLVEELAARDVIVSPLDLDFLTDMLIARRRHDGGLSALSASFNYFKATWRATRKHEPPR